MGILETFLGGAGGAAIVAGIFSIIQWRLSRKAKKEDWSIENGNAVCATRGAEIRRLDANVGNLTIALRAILYDRIKYLAKSYIKRGYITFEEYEDLKRMHSVYHNELCGNGFLDGVMEEVEHLEKRVA